MKPTVYDFSGYVTRYNIKCADGRTIRNPAFKDMNGRTVPLVYNHIHDDPNNVMGNIYLEHREDGVYGYGSFNKTPQGQNGKALIEHKDISHLSIWANKLKETQSRDVLHGVIREVSLVLSGANPGAFIENLSIQHSDGSFTEQEDEAIMFNNSPLDYDSPEFYHVDTSEETNTEDKTMVDALESLTEDQQKLMAVLIKAAIDGENEDLEASHTEGEEMKHNIFDSQETVVQRPRLTPEQLNEIISDAKKVGSFKESFLAHAVEYGIENIELLFPDARTLTTSPDFVSRQMEWVNKVLNNSRHAPFSRIKSLSADITLEDARAKGYIKGTLKKEEFFAVSRRITTPTTIYKKQKLDREDIIEITDLDVVAFLKMEMRLMLNEEIARAILIGDQREVDDDAKIDETKIRPIATDADFYTTSVAIAPGLAGNSLVEAMLRARKHYKGSGNPTLFTTEDILTDMLLAKDKVGRRLYNTVQELAATLRVEDIVAVEVMENITSSNSTMMGVMVNMRDYTIGTNRGGEVSMFDDFDLDYNQMKYLIETHMSGALTKPKSAIAFWQAIGTRAIPTAPTFVSATNTLTIPTVTGVVYTIDDVEVDAGSIVIDEDTTVDAEPATNYYFTPGTISSWTFDYNAG